MEALVEYIGSLLPSTPAWLLMVVIVPAVIRQSRMK